VCAFNFHARDSNLRTTCLQRLSLSRPILAYFQLTVLNFNCERTRFALYAGTQVRSRAARDYALCVCARPLFCIIARVCALHERYCTMCILKYACSQRVACTSAWAQFERCRLIKSFCAEIITGKAVQKQRRMVPTACF
jgi:hypothetical protein